MDTTFITLGIAVPAPGTEFYRYVEGNGFLENRDWSRFDPMKKPVFSYPWLSSDEIAYYSRHGLQQFYLRPWYILERLVSIRSFSEFSSSLGDFRGFMSRYVFNKGRK